MKCWEECKESVSKEISHGENNVCNSCVHLCDDAGFENVIKILF